MSEPVNTHLNEGVLGDYLEDFHFGALRIILFHLLPNLFIVTKECADSGVRGGGGPGLLQE
jgi:hypothetical protein